VFEGSRITLQTVRSCQQVFSAAFIAHVEASYEDETAKNALCTVVPHPNTDLDFLRVALANGLNELRWAWDPDLTAWLASIRLNLFGARPSVADATMIEAERRLMESAPAAIATLQRLLADAPAG
jgi:hypothetical protein